MTILLNENHEARYWHSLQSRENITTSVKAVCRTTLQRLFAVVRFRAAWIKAYGAAAGVAAAVAKANPKRISYTMRSQSTTACSETQVVGDTT